MSEQRTLIARSAAIQKSFATINWASMFSAFIYPALGLAVLVLAIVLGLALEAVAIHWWYAPIAMAVVAFTVFMCNQGIGPLHRIWQHRAGELKLPAQIFVMFNCILAMQGQLKDWVNYHSQHHRFADKPGDPHNPHESKAWAWVGWIIWRDPKDTARPSPMWLQNIPAVKVGDKYYNTFSLLLHLVVPAVIYAIVWMAGGSLVLTAIIHAAVVIGRGIQFHATTLGINVAGHLNVPRWVTLLLAMLTGGEAFHAHHHDFPKSVLHLPRKGFLNRVFDYNGSFLLLLEKLKLAGNFAVAPQFSEQKAA